jgi:hypothetical protein
MALTDGLAELATLEQHPATGARGRQHPGGYEQAAKQRRPENEGGKDELAGHLLGIGRRPRID